MKIRPFFYGFAEGLTTPMIFLVNLFLPKKYKLNYFDSIDAYLKYENRKRLEHIKCLTKKVKKIKNG